MDLGKADKVEGQTTMSRPQTQHGYIFESHGAFHIRYYVHEKGVRKRKSRKLCLKDDIHPSKDSHAVLTLAEDFILRINAANAFNDGQPGHECPICGNRCKRTIEQKFAPRI
jgi:hypothetical protein